MRFIIPTPSRSPGAASVGKTRSWFQFFFALEDRSRQEPDLRFQISSGFQISTAHTRSQISDLLGHGGFTHANLAVSCLFCVASAANLWISDLDFRYPEDFGSSNCMQDLRFWISRRFRLKSWGFGESKISDFTCPRLGFQTDAPPENLSGKTRLLVVQSTNDNWLHVH